MSRITICLLSIGICVVATGFFSETKRQTDAQPGAPQADFETRRKWGERKFQEYLSSVEEWTRTAPVITTDVGRVIKVAPIGSPNRRIYGFTDGSCAIMQLEVVGEKGTGILLLPSVVMSYQLEIREIGDEASWRTDSTHHIVNLSGVNYLAHLKIEEQYEQLMNFQPQQDAEEFLFLWSLLEKTIEQKLPQYRYPGRTKQPQLVGLHSLYRVPILKHKADLLVSWERPEDSTAAYCELAEALMYRIRWEKRRTWQQDAEDLALTNLALDKANELIPDRIATLRLARERVAMSLRLGNGMEEERDSKRNLGIFYEAATREAKSFPYLKRTLGNFEVSPDPQIGTEGIYVNKHRRYAASVYLQLKGRKGQGSLHLRFRENDDAEPIDLFADEPRLPDYPLVFKSPQWESSDGHKIKLSARTGEPIDK